MKSFVVCGALVMKDDRFVLVQEAEGHVRGKWNFPAGHMNDDEDIFTAAIREVKEETNLAVKLDGLIGVYQSKSISGNNVIKIMFKASVISGELKAAKGELLDAKWFAFDEFKAVRDEDIRAKDWRQLIDDYQKRGVLPLDAIRVHGL